MYLSSFFLPIILPISLLFSSNHSVNCSIAQSINQSINQSTNQRISQSINQTINQPINKSMLYLSSFQVDQPEISVVYKHHEVWMMWTHRRIKSSPSSFSLETKLNIKSHISYFYSSTKHEILKISNHNLQLGCFEQLVQVKFQPKKIILLFPVQWFIFTLKSFYPLYIFIRFYFKMVEKKNYFQELKNLLQAIN